MAPPDEKPEAEMKGGGMVKVPAAGMLPADESKATATELPSPARAPANGTRSGMAVDAAQPESEKKSAAKDLPSPE